MTIKEYLEIHTGEGIKSIGIYLSEEACKEKDLKSDVVDAHVSIVDLVKYLNLEIDHVDLGIFDENAIDFKGNPITLQYIRACIHVKGR